MIAWTFHELDITDPVMFTAFANRQVRSFYQVFFINVVPVNFMNFFTIFIDIYIWNMYCGSFSVKHTDRENLNETQRPECFI